tara:strand:- start:2643 stop:3113 length:471 start_codon:yes stop_codon:yes gene_type:complete
MSGITASGIWTTTVTTTQQSPLGFVLTTPNGDYGLQEWVYIYNDDPAVLAVGDCVMIDTDYVPYHAIKTGGPHDSLKIIGCAQHVIAAGSYGFVLQTGKGLARGDGSVAKGDSIVSHTTAYVDTMAAGEENMVIGLALADDGVAGATFSVLLSCGL